MKVLYPDNYASSFSATGASADFPITNVEDEHPKYVCKGTGRDLTISFLVAAGSDTIAAFNSNATTCTITITFIAPISGRSPLEARTAAVASGGGPANNPLGFRSTGVGAVSPSVEIYDLKGSANGALWVEYSGGSSGHNISLALHSPPGTYCQVGVILGGQRKEYEEPFYGIQEGLKSFDAVEQYNGGEVHIDDGDTVRTFAFTLLEDLDPDWWEFMLEVAQQKGKHPMAWKLISDSTDREWIVYARFDGSMPSGRHEIEDNGEIFSYLEISIIEVL